MRSHMWGAAVTVGVLALAGCSGRGGSDAKATATKATTAATTAPVAELSKKWKPKLDALFSDASGVAACQAPGSEACAAALSDTMDVLNGVLDDINAAGARDAYPSSMKQITKMVDAADGYASAGCAGDPSSAEDASPCYGYAIKVTGGVPVLGMTLPTDELNA